MSTPPSADPNPMAHQTDAPPPEPRNGFGITALICGIIGSLAGLIPLLAPIAITLGIIGLIFGLLALSRVRKRRATNRVMSWFGSVLSVLAIVLGVIGAVVVGNAFNDLDDALTGDTYSVAEGDDKDAPNSPARDVKLGDQDVSQGSGVSSVPVTVTNTTDGARDYDITIEWIDASGERIHSESVYVTDLGSEQKATEEVTAFGDNGELSDWENATVRVSEISRTESG